MEEAILCTLCDDPLDNDTAEIVAVREKGLNTLIKKSMERRDNKHFNWDGKSSVKFHTTCRKRYCKISVTTPLKRIKSQPSPSQPPPSLLSPSQPLLSQPSSSDKGIINVFDFRTVCFFCGKQIHCYKQQINSVKQQHIHDQLIDMAERRNDEVGRKLIKRLQGVSLVDVGASYHCKCYNNFRASTNRRPISLTTKNKIIKLRKVCRYIENSGEFQFHLSALKAVMGKKPLDSRWLFQKLRKKYGDQIMILRHTGREPIIFYKTFNVTKICSNWICDKNSVSELEKKTIFTVAAEMLRDEVLKLNYNNEYYPPATQFLSNVKLAIPPSLTSFLGELLLGENSVDSDNIAVKRNCIAHSIVSIIRQKDFSSSLQLAVGTYVYRKTGSRLIIDLLSKLGVCSSYYSIQLHEASTIMDPPTTNVDKTFVQFVFDNTDHNVGTLDGHETFHCLGGIAAYTPSSSISYEGGSKKLKKMPSPSVLASQKRIETVPYGNFNSSALEAMKYVDTKQLRLGERPSLPASYSAYLWAKFFEVPKIPSWKGFMEVLSMAVPYETSHIVCLPFVNQPPSNLTTLNTALHYAAAEGAKLNQKTVFVTFDQPLYKSAYFIAAQSQNGPLKNVKIRLGGFHLCMSYLGAVGHVMKGSGLEELWSTVYSPVSVKKMVTGQAFSRAIRAHTLTYTALGHIVCKRIRLAEELKNEFLLFFAYWSKEPPLLEDCDSNVFLEELGETFLRKLQEVQQNGKTAKLWVQYFHSVTVALQFLHAERLGDWKLHLQSVQDMLPLFHAAGHFPYAKSAQVYLQDMANLEESMDPEEFKEFTEKGFFTIRRTEKAWSGIWSDMTIEQTLNRFFGTDLKHGRGVTPSVVARYLQAMPSVFNIMECLENYCGLKSTSSEQHVDISKSRIKRDDEETSKFLFWLNEHDPFKPDEDLKSLSTGVIGGPQINCHEAIKRGLKGMQLMVDKNMEKIKLSKLYKVKPLADANKLAHRNNTEGVTVNTFSLIQKMFVSFGGDNDFIRRAFNYELAPFPLSLFDEQGFMRKTPKSDLYNILKPLTQNYRRLASDIYVIDGGWLLHHVVWPHGKKFNEICDLYFWYIQRNFGADATIIFDGYNNERIGTKSYERYRRGEKCVAADVNIVEDNVVTLSQSKFLSNVENKMDFIDLLCTFLSKKNVATKVAEEDADALIVRTAIELKKPHINVIITGNDVDLLVLLISLTADNENIFFEKQTPGKKPNVLYKPSDTYKNIKPFLLFAHAFSGCDTTSAFFKKGKRMIISLLTEDENLRESVSVFYQPHHTVSELYPVAEKIIFKLYKSNNEQVSSIGDSRYYQYISTVTIMKKEVSLASLPPTKIALEEHIKRVYYQIQLWLGRQLNPEEWGWKRRHIILFPTMSTEDPAPKELLRQIRCGCQTDCNTAKCGCRVKGLKCNISCKNCKGKSCKNAPTTSTDLDIEMREDENINRSEENDEGEKEGEDDEGEEEGKDDDDEEELEEGEDGGGGGGGGDEEQEEGEDDEGEEQEEGEDDDGEEQGGDEEEGEGDEDEENDGSEYDDEEGSYEEVKKGKEYDDDDEEENNYGEEDGSEDNDEDEDYDADETDEEMEVDFENY